MIYIHKILPLLVLPIMFVVILILIGLRKDKKKLILLAVSLLYIASTAIFSNFFFRQVEGEYARTPMADITPAAAIVVLGGMLNIVEQGGQIFTEWTDPDRFFGGIALYHADKADALVFTAAKMPWHTVQKTEGALLKQFALEQGVPEEAIKLTQRVTNTAEEAVAVKALLGANKKIILVTSAFHMYRSKKLFENQGFEVIPYKVDYKVLENQQTTLMDFLPSARNLELTEIGVREILGRIYYGIKGYQ